MTSLRHSPLDARHRALRAHMGAFGGWEMPISYEGTIAEHTAVRTGAGIFDVSHLGKFMALGETAREDLDRALTNRIADLEIGKARYTLILNDEAGIIDDLIVYVLDVERALVVPNAANVERVRERVASVGARVRPLDWATLAVQGPRSQEILRAVLPKVPDLPYLGVAEIDDDIVVARTGYTGEHGYEIFSEPADAPAIWDAVIDAGATPAGLAARDTLRLEMGYPLHGNDIDQDTTPREAGLGWAVAKAKASYLGKDANESRPPRKQLVGLKMTDKVIPRRHSVVSQGGRPIGEVTSGTFSPTLRIGIALAYVEPGSVNEGDRVDVEVRQKTGRGVVTKPPFVESDPRR
jgi:aminomethyltransferase